MMAKMLPTPSMKLFAPQIVRYCPVATVKISIGVFRQEAGVFDVAQCVEVVIGERRILRPLLFPGLDQMTARAEFAVETAGPGGIGAADFQLAGAADQAVGDPALKGRIVVLIRTGGEVKRVAIGHTVARVNLAVTGAEQNYRDQDDRSHDRSIRHIPHEG